MLSVVTGVDEVTEAVSFFVVDGNSVEPRQTISKEKMMRILSKFSTDACHNIYSNIAVLSNAWGCYVLTTNGTWFGVFYCGGLHKRPYSMNISYIVIGVA